MNATIDDKIHPYLAKSFAEKRRLLIVQQVEAALRFELSDEHIEEREYDEKARLRVQRIINRKVFRGEAYERYATFVAGLPESGGETDVESQIRSQMDLDLCSIASNENLQKDVLKAVRSYADVIPSERWPAVLCMTQDPDDVERLRRQVESLNFPILPAGPLERFGIVKFASPPETGFIRKIAGLTETRSIADASTPVAAPRPMRVSPMMAEARRIIGLTREIAESYGQNVVVAILDSGLDFGHPAFRGFSRSDYRNFTSGDDADLDGHGTHVTSIAVGGDVSRNGMYSGVAPKARLVFGKVISGDGGGDLESVLNGMAWAVFDKRADILSMSMGDPGTPPNGLSIWTKACDEAFRQGTVVCVSAGNHEEAGPETVVVPGDSRTTVTIGAIDKDGQLASFSAHGSMNPASPIFGKPNCVGPGVDIVGARSARACFAPGQIVDALHVCLSGTSMAAPAIAGCMALLKSKARFMGWEITPQDLVNSFYAACRPLRNPSGEEYRRDIEVGHGLIDIQAAFAEMEQSASKRASRTAGIHPINPAADRTFQDSAKVRSQSGVMMNRELEPDVCYRCGKRYLTKVGIFSPVWKCRECGAPICEVCWQLGYVECEQHRTNRTPG